MFLVFLAWNPDYPLRMLQDCDVFTLVDHTHEHLDTDKSESQRNYILRMKYTSKIYNLMMKPVMMTNLRRLEQQEQSCMAIFFEKTNDVDTVQELIIDTRTIKFCDIVNYIQPIDSVNLTADDLIMRQQKHWDFTNELLRHNISGLQMNELDNGKYLMSMEHGAGLTVRKVSSNEKIVTMDIVKTINCTVRGSAYIENYEVPNTVEDIQIQCEIIDMGQK